MKKRVGLKEARKIFKKRPLRNQLADRRTNAKIIVTPYSKNSWKWKQNPEKYDMRLVDTKTRTKHKLINNKVFVPFGRTKSRNKAEQRKREILTSFSSNIVLSEKTSTQKLSKKSGVVVKYRKTKKGYNLFVSPKGKRKSLMHPIVVQKGRA